MLLNALSLLLRSIVVFGVGLTIGGVTFEIGGNDNIAVGVAILVFTSGAVWAISSFYEPLKVLSVTASKISKVLSVTASKISGYKNKRVRKSNMQRLEHEMLRLKELKDADIVTEEEYNLKIASLKKHYLEL